MVTPTGNQSETGKTNTSLNHDGKRWKQAGSKTAFREGGREGIIPESTEAKVRGHCIMLVNPRDSGKISARGTPNISEGVADSEVTKWNNFIPWQ